MGSKAKHANDILKIVLAARKPGQYYVEPFVGGANVMSHVPTVEAEHGYATGPRLGCDINRYMVALHTALAAGWQPPRDLKPQEYRLIKARPDDFPPELVAFVATGVTFGSMWFGEYVKDGPGENRCRQSADSCLRDAPGLTGAEFRHWEFNSDDMSAFLKAHKPALVYCDPPYVNTTSYAGAKKTIKVGDSLGANTWKASKFWKWADALVDEGHSVFVSEYTGPSTDVYASLPQSDAEKATRAAAAAFQASTEYSAAGMEEHFARIKSHEAERRAAAEAMCARWEVVWSKEVTADFSASREAGVKTGKVEVEKLFHRKAA